MPHGRRCEKLNYCQKVDVEDDVRSILWSEIAHEADRNSFLTVRSEDDQNPLHKWQIEPGSKMRENERQK